MGEQVEVKRRESSRSRERRHKERIEAAKARVEADKGPRPAWIMPTPEEMAAQAAVASGGATLLKEPPETREELLKMPVSKLKALLKEYGKTVRGCIQKSDFA